MRILDLASIELIPTTQVKVLGRINTQKTTSLLILSEEDLLDGDLPCKIKGYSFEIILIPKIFKDLLNEDENLKELKYHIPLDGRIEYF
jgi:hypothetical protein